MCAFATSGVLQNFWLANAFSPRKTKSPVPTETGQNVRILLTTYLHISQYAPVYGGLPSPLTLLSEARLGSDLHAGGRCRFSASPTLCIRRGSATLFVTVFVMRLLYTETEELSRGLALFSEAVRCPTPTRGGSSPLTMTGGAVRRFAFSDRL